MNCCVSPTAIDGVAGVTVTRCTTGGGGGGGGGGSVTVNVAVPETLSTDALIVVDPVSLPVARPEALTVATEVSPLVQVKVLPVITMLFES